MPVTKTVYRATETLLLYCDFWDMVDVREDADCWEWTGYRKPTGYGLLGVYREGVGRTATGPHRVAFEVVNGPIPDGLVIDHLCRNRACCNPSHLEAVTQGENNRRIPHRPRASRGASIVERPRKDGAVSYRVMFRLGSKQTGVTFQARDAAEDFVQECHRRGSTKAYLDLLGRELS